MTLVVADTSPLNYLVQIGCEHVVPSLYGRILVPAAVIGELTSEGTPAAVRTWLQANPAWVETRRIREPLSPILAGLHRGEAEAIPLTEQERAGLLLMDDRKGARVARQRGLEVMGTLGVLLQAGKGGFLNLDDALTPLEATDFRCTTELFAHVRASARNARQ